MRNKSIILLSALALSAISHAQVIYATGFESPAFTAGLNVATQDGWVSGSGTSNLPRISTTTVLGGTQSAELLGYPGTGSTIMSTARAVTGTAASVATPWVLTSSIYVTDVAGTTNVNRVYYVQLGTGNNASSVFAGLSLDQAGNLRFATTYANMYQAGGLMAGGTGRFADYANRWVDLTLVYDGATVTGTVSGLGTSGGASVVSGVLAKTGTATTINMASDWTAGSANSNGSAFVDNVKLEVVPEPATMVALSAFALAALRRKKKA